VSVAPAQLAPAGTNHLVHSNIFTAGSQRVVIHSPNNALLQSISTVLLQVTFLGSQGGSSTGLILGNIICSDANGNAVPAQTCSLFVPTTNSSFPCEGGDGTIDVQAGPGCNWTATSNDTWITITSGGSGTGNGSIHYSVSNNSTGSARSGSITVSGLAVTIGQQVCAASTPTPTPGATVNISGHVSYCSNPVRGPVSNVVLTLTGSDSDKTSSDGAGNYAFTGLTSGGTYTVTPSKAALLPTSRSDLSHQDAGGMLPM
jgi:hypothetical protein